MSRPALPVLTTPAHNPATNQHTGTPHQPHTQAPAKGMHACCKTAQYSTVQEHAGRAPRRCACLHPTLQNALTGHIQALPQHTFQPPPGQGIVQFLGDRQSQARPTQWPKTVGRLHIWAENCCTSGLKTDESPVQSPKNHLKNCRAARDKRRHRFLCSCSGRWPDYWCAESVTLLLAAGDAPASAITPPRQHRSCCCCQGSKRAAVCLAAAGC